jgi:hypothetical protein
LVDQAALMKYEITSPDGQRFEVTAPDGATEAEVLSYAKRQFQAVPKDKPFDPTDGMSTTDKVLAGVGKGMVDVGRGAGQMLGLTSQAEIDEARRIDAPLMNTKSGMVGNILGSVAAAAPAMFIPGANTVAGAGVTGAVLGALQPMAADESRLQNAALGGVLGSGAQFGLGKLAGAAQSRLAAKEAEGLTKASQNAVRDETLRASQQAGYVIPPSQAGGGILSRTLEGVSGKYKTNQAAAIKNQNVTDSLARKALGLADDEPITREAMQAVRDRAFQSGYEPLSKAGAIETDRAFQKSLDSIVSDFQGASRSFPDAVDNTIMKRVDALRTGAMDVGDALKMTRILRDEANAAYGASNPALGKATKKAAQVIEDQIERALQSAGKDGAELLKNFREARTLMAKAHNVEKAIVEGGGHVNARVLGAALQRGKPLTDELKTIGGFANNFKDVARIPESGWANPITALDAFGAAGMAGLGAGGLSIALPAARVAARSAILSPMAQRALGPQNYGPGLATRLSPELLAELERRGFGGMLGGSVHP